MFKPSVNLKVLIFIQDVEEGFTKQRLIVIMIRIFVFTKNFVSEKSTLLNNYVEKMFLMIPLFILEIQVHLVIASSSLLE